MKGATVVEVLQDQDVDSGRERPAPHTVATVIAAACALFAVGVFFWISNYQSYMADDFGAMNTARGVSLVAYLGASYQVWNARLSALASYLFLSNRQLFALVNTAALLGVVASMFRLGLRRWPRLSLRDMALSITILAVIWFGAPVQDQTLMWRSGAISYLWPLFFGLLFAIPYAAWFERSTESEIPAESTIEGSGTHRLDARAMWGRLVSRAEHYFLRTQAVTRDTPEDGAAQGDMPEVTTVPRPDLSRLIALAVVLAAGVLRFWQLGNRGLWYDELVTVNLTSNGPLSAVAQTITSDMHPPLFAVLQSLAMPLLGNSDGAVRALPALMGMLTAGIIYLVGEKMLGAKVGLWASTLFAVAPIALHYGQEARPYSQLMLASSLVLLAFVALVEKPTTRRTVLLGIALTGLAYTHVYGVFAAPLVLMAVLTLPRLRNRIGRRIVLSYLIAIVAFLPWAKVILDQVKVLSQNTSQGSWWLQAPVGESPIVTVYNNLFAFAPRVTADMGALFVLLAAIGVVGYVVVRRQPSAAGRFSSPFGVQESDFVWLLLSFALVPIIAGLVLSKEVVPIYHVRYTLVSLPAVYLLVAAGGVRLPWRTGELALAVLLAVGITGLPAYYNDSLGKGEWRAATRYVMSNSDNGTAMLMDGITGVDIDSYGLILGRKEGFGSIMVVQSDPSDETSVTGAMWKGAWLPVNLDSYIGEHDRVLAALEDSRNPFFAYMDKKEGWQPTGTWNRPDTATIRTWERVASRATTVTP